MMPVAAFLTHDRAVPQLRDRLALFLFETGAGKRP
jgi:hypothetical protein